MTENPYPNLNPGHFKAVSLLIIDDDDIDATALRRALHKLKLLNPLYRAKDGLEAIEMLRNGNVPSPYIILLDINMPRMDGMELLRRLRQKSDLPVIFLTSKDEEIDE